jgi:hypothetical protein
MCFMSVLLSVCWSSSFITVYPQIAVSYLAPLPLLSPVIDKRFRDIAMGTRSYCRHVFGGLFCRLWIILLEARDNIVRNGYAMSGISGRLCHGR